LCEALLCGRTAQLLQSRPIYMYILYNNKKTVGSPRSDEAHQESGQRRIPYIHEEMKIYIHKSSDGYDGQHCGNEGRVTAVTCRAPTRNGGKQERRKLIASVVTSQVLYSAPVWAKAATTSSYMSGLGRTYRLCATRIFCADNLRGSGAGHGWSSSSTRASKRGCRSLGNGHEHGRPI